MQNYEKKHLMSWYALPCNSDALVTKAERVRCSRNRCVSIATVVGEPRSFGVMLIARLNVKFLLTKESKADGGWCGPAPRRRGKKLGSPARVGWAWPEARASCSGEHVVPPASLPLCHRVCVKGCSFSVFSVSASSSRSAADLLFFPPAPSLPHPALLSATVPGIRRQPGRLHRTRERKGERQRRRVCVCLGVVVVVEHVCVCGVCV